MKVLVDTNIWSLALRRRNTPDNDVVVELRRLIDSEQPLLLPDIIRLEILAGITPLERQRSVRRDLDAFPTLKLSTNDHDLAAEYFSTCVSKGVQAGLVDLLLCAASIRRKMPVFTQARDFLQYAKHLPVKLHRTDLTFA